MGYQPKTWSVDGRGPVWILVTFAALFIGGGIWAIYASEKHCKAHPEECKERRVRMLCEEQDDDGDGFIFDRVLP